MNWSSLDAAKEQLHNKEITHALNVGKPFVIFMQVHMIALLQETSKSSLPNYVGAAVDLKLQSPNEMGLCL